MRSIFDAEARESEGAQKGAVPQTNSRDREPLGLRGLLRSRCLAEEDLGNQLNGSGIDENKDSLAQIPITANPRYTMDNTATFSIDDLGAAA